jgi:ABC-type transporter Mla subunit MlaD
MSRWSILVLTSLLSVGPLLAQKEQRQTLTPAEVEQIREAGIDPDARVKLYAKFIDDHVETIAGLTKRAHSSARVYRLDNELQNLAALMDELGSNLDQYGDRKADMRKSLKLLSDSSPHWLGTLHDLPTESGFELSLKEAIDSSQDLAEQAKQMLSEQTDYFNLHKDQRGQDRSEPQ